MTSRCITLQIASTKFAIRCSYQPFMNWLTEVCADFLASGKPHARLNLSFDTTTKITLPPETSFSITHNYDDDETNFRVICSNPDNPDKMFRSILHICLYCSIVSKQPPDLWIHSAGVIYRDWAYIFPGLSGAGKSTICNILAKEPGVTILHDEIVALSKNGEGFCAWSSPLRGERPATCCVGAPLRAIFFLNHAENNHAAKLSGIKVPRLLAANMIRLATVIDDSMTSGVRESYKLMLALAERVPCYNLYFKPDSGFWEYIEQLSMEESAIEVKKE